MNTRSKMKEHTRTARETNDKTKRRENTPAEYMIQLCISDDEQCSVFLGIFSSSLLKSLGGLINCVPICLNYNLQLYKIACRISLFLPFLLLFQFQLFFFENPRM